MKSSSEYQITTKVYCFHNGSLDFLMHQVSYNQEKLWYEIVADYKSAESSGLFQLSRV